MTLKASKLRQHNGCEKCGSDRISAITCTHRKGVELHCAGCGHIETCYGGVSEDQLAPPATMSAQVEREFRSQNRMKSWFRR
jgi:hypothetical protein